MFAVMAIGAPIGMLLYSAAGFKAVALSTIGAPLLTLLLVDIVCRR